MYTRLTANMVGAQKRYETLNGRQYLVVPTVMLTEGVHAGSKGPLLYDKETLGTNFQSWNHRPILMEHPVANGEGISGCDPGVISAQGVGTLFHTTYDGRLKTESWLDEAKIKTLDNKVLERIHNGESVEVSTGLYHDLDPTPGQWNGEQYTGVVRNMQPDHLAILPNAKGACSINDGAGLLRNKEGETGLSFDDIRQQLSALVRPVKETPLACESSGYTWVCDVYPKYAICETNNKTFKVGYKVKAGKVSLEGEPEEVRKVTTYVTANGRSVHNEDMQGPMKTPKLPPPSAGQLSDVMRKNQFQKALQEKYSGVQQEGDWGGWVTDLYANYVVWSKDNKLFRLPYTYDDDMIRFDGEPEEVERVSEYRARRDVPIDGTSSPYAANKGTNMAVQFVSKQQVESIIRLAEIAKSGQLTVNTMHAGAHQFLHDATMQADAHYPPADGKSDSQVRTEHRKAATDKMIAGGGWKEEDRKFLEGLPDDHFAKVEAHTMAGAKQPIVPYTYDGIGDRSSVHSPAAAAQNAQQQDPTLAYIQAAPPEVAEVLQNAMATHQAQKTALVKRITSNKANRFNPEWLMKQPVPVLQSMAALAGGQSHQQQTANYGGQADVPMFLNNNQFQEPIDNAEMEILPVPQMSFEKTKAS